MSDEEDEWVEEEDGTFSFKRGVKPVKSDIPLDEEQQRAVDMCLDPTIRICAVDGKAGTGKTTILKYITAMFMEQDLKVQLCSPTGKAARRVTEVTGYSALTIHKLLEFPMPGEIDEKTGKALLPSYPRRKPSRPLEVDVVLVDEYAMVEPRLHRFLIDALPKHAIIRSFGDINQLAPVVEGPQSEKERSPFKRILEDFPKVTLETIHRQGEGSGIIQAASDILKGIAPKLNDEFYLEFVNSAQHWTALRKLLATTDFSIIENQIIVPSKKGTIGVHALNEQLQMFYQQPNQPYLNLQRHSWDKDHPCRVMPGDKVVWTKNDYNLDILNGEFGIVREINRDDRTVVIEFADREVVVPPLLEIDQGEDRAPIVYNPQVQLDLAYAVTTHKVQGSEMQHVAYLLDDYHLRHLANRNNLYTAVTRARAKVNVLTTRQAYSKALMKVEN